MLRLRVTPRRGLVKAPNRTRKVSDWLILKEVPVWVNERKEEITMTV